MTDDDRLTALEMRVADLALLSDTVALIHRSLAALYEEAQEHRWDLPMGWSSDLHRLEDLGRSLRP